MRRLVFEKNVCEPSIFNRHLKLLCLLSKSIQIFDFVLNLNWGCSKCIEIALFASWNSDFQCFFWLAVWFHAFPTIIALFASWKLLELFNTGFEHKLRITVSSTSVQGQNGAAPATFRMQIEQIEHTLSSLKFSSEKMENLNAFWASAWEIKMPVINWRKMLNIRRLLS